MPLRVLFISDSFPRADAPLSHIGGVQRVAVELYRSLETRPELEMHEMVLRSSRRWNSLLCIPFECSLPWRVPRYVARHGIDIILFTSPSCAIPVVLMAGRLASLGAAVVSLAHGLEVTQRPPGYQIIIRRVLASLDGVLPVSRATAEVCLERGIEPGKVFVVPNGVDPRRFEQADRESVQDPGGMIAGQPAPVPGTFLLLSVGRQVRRKGFAWFVQEAMPRLPDHVQYWLAGSGPQREEIAAAATRAGVAERVRLLGTVTEDQLIELYRRAHLLIMPNIPIPNDMEGFGVVMLEAGACGLPSIAADLEGIRDVIINGANGYLCASRNAEAFCRKIHELMQDREALARLSQSTRETVTSRFPWSVIAQRHVEVLSQIATRRNPKGTRVPRR